MSALPEPWCDLTSQRRRRLADLPDVEAVERAGLDALGQALSAPVRPPDPAAWTEEAWAYYDRARQEIDRRLSELMPSTGDLTREGVAAVLRDWTASAGLSVPDGWLDDRLDLFCAAYAHTALTAWAQDVLRRLGRRPHDESAVAAAAGRCARHGLASGDAANLLRTLGAPHGERELLLVLADDATDSRTRVEARYALDCLLRPARQERGRQSPSGEHPLLPPAVRQLPYGWDGGFAWPVDLPETRENVGQAREVLLGCLPPEPVAEPVPDADWQGTEDEELPDWVEIRAVVRELMPYAARVTEERMAEAMRQCVLLGIPGVPVDANGAEGDRFVRRWVGWISGWIAAETFTWLGMYVDDESLVTPWAMELAERYARLGCVPDQAVAMLAWHGSVPAAREALARLAADPSLPPAVREQAARGLEP